MSNEYHKLIDEDSNESNITIYEDKKESENDFNYVNTKNLIWKKRKEKKKQLLVIFISSILIILLYGLIYKINKVKSFDKSNYKDYGVMVYSYRYQHPSATENLSGTGNIGDYIQSLAAWQYLPQDIKPYFIDRDSVKLYSGPKVTMIVNGWYHLFEYNEYFSDNIRPIFVSFHIDNPNSFTNSTKKYLKKHEPIGCRDYNTQRFLEQNGINSYFSGCLTTTLDINYKLDQNERDGKIIFCDYKFGDYEPADQILKSLKDYDFSNVELTSHSVSKKISYEERFEIAKSFLKRYGKAKLVVTTKIHCALPCLAMGTPVILINKKYDFKRFEGIYELLNTIGVNHDGIFSSRIRQDQDGQVINPDDYLKFANKLKQTVRNEL